MFRKLEKKLKLHIMYTVSIILFLSLISIYISFSNIVFNDFSQKSIRFSTQTTKSLTMRMNYIEETAHISIKKYDLSNIITSDKYDPFLNTRLREIMEYNPDIQGVSVYGKNKFMYFSNSYYTNSSLGFLASDSFFKSIQNQKSKWMFIKKSELPIDYPYGSDMLLCISPIFTANNDMCGYLIIDTPNNFIRNIMKKSNSIFFDNATIFMATERGNILISTQTNLADKVEEQLNTYKDIKTGYLYLNHKRILVTNNNIENTDIHLVMYRTLKYIDTQLNILKMFFGALFICLLALCHLSIRYLIEGIINPLMELYNKMQDYITEQKI